MGDDFSDFTLDYESPFASFSSGAPISSKPWSRWKPRCL